ncbi:MAG: PspC domain-containing protein [Pseudomonadales bacterium]|nr:PspC domain-containing protein [Pseudomonadales bacterium]
MSSFDRIRSRLARDTRTGWFGGVCAGLGRTLNIDPKFLRAGVVILAVLSPKIVIAAYLVAWILLPAQNEIDYSS